MVALNKGHFNLKRNKGSKSRNRLGSTQCRPVDTVSSSVILRINEVLIDFSQSVHSVIYLSKTRKNLEAHVCFLDF